MLTLEDRIKSFDAYKQRFESWEASQTIIDENKAFWELKKPGSSVQKVCLFRDGSTMCIYGDYGSYTFDRMTWTGTPWNIYYNNIGYMLEKLSHESAESVVIFDPDLAKEQFLRWVEEYMMYKHAFETFSEKAMAFLKSDADYPYQGDVDDFFENLVYDEDTDYGNYDEFYTLIGVANRALRSMEDKAEWINFIRSEAANLEDLEEDMCNSTLWGFGKSYNQRYLVSLYALKVISQKLPNPGKEK